MMCFCMELKLLDMHDKSTACMSKRLNRRINAFYSCESSTLLLQLDLFIQQVRSGLGRVECGS